MLEAVLFDQDGVLVDTERDGHRIAFNEAFRELGIPIVWDVGTYGKLLSVGGGKERLRYFLQEYHADAADILNGHPIEQIHKKKTDIFMEMINSGSMSLRTGVLRLMKELSENDISISICTTSNENVARTLHKTLLSEIPIPYIFAGDIVARKKPHPDIYLLALEQMNLNPRDCVVIEDSRNGLMAAKGAGLKVVITKSFYTMDEDFSEADLVLDCLGEKKNEWFATGKSAPVSIEELGLRELQGLESLR